MWTSKLKTGKNIQKSWTPGESGETPVFPGHSGNVHTRASRTYLSGEEMVHCPLCGSRTEFGELPRDSWQLHVCLKCNHSFIAVPGGPEEEEMNLSRDFVWRGSWTMNQDNRIETQPCVEKTEEGLIPTLAISYAGGEPTYETAEPQTALDQAKSAAVELENDWHQRETDEVAAEMASVTPVQLPAKMNQVQA